MTKIIDEFKTSINSTYEREGIFAAVVWTIVLPVFMVSAMVTDIIYNA